MTRSVSAVLARATRELGSAAEARTLLAHALRTAPPRLLLIEEVDGAAARRLEDLVARRLAGVPVQHLTGEAHFRTVTVAVGPGVFIPRPETEVMTGWAVDRLRELQAEGAAEPVVVELCAGSGAISLAVATEFPAARLHCVELSEDAWPWLERNLARTGVDARPGDMADAFADLDGGVDLVIANPPYIPLESYPDVPVEVRDYDPALALFSGQDGLDALRVVADVAARLLRPGGWVCAEHADVQGESAPGIFVRHGGFRWIADHRDLTGRPRFVVAQRAGRMDP